jgi:hypothetical protein
MSTVSIDRAVASGFCPHQTLGRLPGVLWCDTTAAAFLSASSYRGGNSSTRGSMMMRMSSQHHLRTTLEPAFVSRGHRVAWRQVAAVANDPDQPWNPRLQVLKESGLGWVAAVSFHNNPQPEKNGIVLYMARDSVDTERLKDFTNEQYLIAATQWIGALYALQEPRQMAMAARQAQSVQGWHSLKHSVQRLVQNQVNLKEAMVRGGSQQQQQKQESMEQLGTTTTGGSAMDHGRRRRNSTKQTTIPTTPTTKQLTPQRWKRIRRKLQAVGTKMAGANIQPPPPMSWTESMVTFCAAGMTMYAVTQVSRHLEETYGIDYRIQLGYVTYEYFYV